MSDIQNEKPKRGKSRKTKDQEMKIDSVPENGERDSLSQIEWNESTAHLGFAETSNEVSVEVAIEAATSIEADAGKISNLDSQVEFLSNLTTNQESIQATDAVAEESAQISAPSISHFEELARRVAETVANNQVEESVISPDEMISAGVETSQLAELDSSEFFMNAPDNIDLNREQNNEDRESQESQFAESASEQSMDQVSIGVLEEGLSLAENDADPEPAEFVEHDRLISIIESLLFSTDKPVSTATIKQVFKGTNVRSKDISRAIDLLASEYAGSQRGVTLEEINGGYQLRTKADNTEFLRRLAKVRPFRLSGPALEVMSIVAYKQPITKHEIDEIRGVESGHLLRALMERGLVSFGEKSELPGKPMTYQSTRKFLETFGLRNIRELPSLGEIDELLPEGIGEVEEEEKETLSDLTDQMSQTIGSTYSEGEDELLKINEQLKAVDTTSEFFEQEKIRERERRDREKAQDIREKLVLGDSVEEKEKRWLDRYEAKLLQPDVSVYEQTVAGNAANGSELPAPIDNEAKIQSELSIDRDLEALTAESLTINGQLNDQTVAGQNDNDHALVDDLDSELEESIDEELVGNIDWDDDAEKEV